MSCSIDDMAISIVHQAKCTYAMGVKSAVLFVLDVRLGLYSGATAPDLKWIKDSSWAESIRLLNEPPGSLPYGELIVDFDTRTIIDRSLYSTPFKMIFEWLLETFDDPTVATLPPESLREHLRYGRVRIVDPVGVFHKDYTGAFVPPADYQEAEVALRKYAEDHPVMMAVFDAPPGWEYISE